MKNKIKTIFLRSNWAKIFQVKFRDSLSGPSSYNKVTIKLWNSSPMKERFPWFLSGDSTFYHWQSILKTVHTIESNNFSKPCHKLLKTFLLYLCFILFGILIEILMYILHSICIWVEIHMYHFARPFFTPLNGHKMGL